MPQDDLEPLITECPNCQTRFRVVEAQLQRARGRVRCGACLTVFDGVERLVLDSDTAPDEAVTREALDDLLDELAGATAPSGDQPEHSTAAAAVAERQADQREPSPPAVTSTPEPAGDAVVPPDEPSAAAEKADEAAPIAPEPVEKAAAPAPEPVRPAEQPAAPAPPAVSVSTSIPAPAAASASEPAPARAIFFGEERNRRPWVWGGIAAGLVLLAVQILWYQFDAWAVRPEWRGVYSFACGLLGCELPAQRDLSLLGTRNLIVRSDPEHPGRLMVDAVIVNTADFPQPFPVLELQFTSLRGNLVASRRYHPDEYLAGDATGLTLIPPRTPVQIALGLDDPGPDAVNYQLNFR